MYANGNGYSSSIHHHRTVYEEIFRFEFVGEYRTLFCIRTSLYIKHHAALALKLPDVCHSFFMKDVFLLPSLRDRVKVICEGKSILI